ncbi:hypothetical protein IC582_025346 [Cucumis melo]
MIFFGYLFLKKVFNESVMIVVSREFHFDLHHHRLEEDHPQLLYCVAIKNH